MSSTSVTTTTRVEIKLPAGLPQLLESLARECIRKQPENIYEFLADFTEQKLLLEKRDSDKVKLQGTGATGEKEEVQAQAALKIQASYRGYKTRKDLKKKASEEKIQNEEYEIAPEIPEISNEAIRETREDEAAIKIQSGVRGFLTRRRLQKQRSNNNIDSFRDEHHLSMDAAAAGAGPSPREEVETSKEEPEPAIMDEHELAVERILKEYGQPDYASPATSSAGNAHSSDESPSPEEMVEKIIPLEELEAGIAELIIELPPVEKPSEILPTSESLENSAQFSSENDESKNNENEEEAPEESRRSFDAREEVVVEEPVSETPVASEEAKFIKVLSESSSTDEQDPTATATVTRINKVSFESEPTNFIDSHPASSSPSPTATAVEEEFTENANTSSVDVELKNEQVSSAQHVVDDVLAEAKTIVASLEAMESSDKEEPSANVSKDGSQSESERSQNEIIQVELISNFSNLDNEFEEKDSKPMSENDAAIIPSVKDEKVVVQVQEEPVPLRRNIEENKKPVVDETTAVVRRSKRNTSTAAAVQNKYRSGFVEVEREPIPNKTPKNKSLDHINESDLDAEIENEVMNNAATRIQAGFRGFKARRTLNKAKDSATKIQASFRGYKARKKVEQEKKAVVTIQATVRGFLTRRRLAKLKMANQSKRRKSSLGAKLQRRRSSQLNAAAIRIQSAFRGYTVRKTYNQNRQKSSSPADLRIEDVAAQDYITN